MTDIQGFDWAQTMDIFLLIGIVLVTIILIVFAFFYLRANRDFDLSLKSLGSQEDLAEINRQILTKQDELKRLEKQERTLRDNINDLSAKQATVDEVNSQLNNLGMLYHEKSKALNELEQKLVKSQALQDFVESHQQDQLSEIERLIEEKQKRLDELSQQVNEQNGAKVMSEALTGAFETVKADLSDISKAEAIVAGLEDQLEQLKAERQSINDELAALDDELQKHSVEEKVGDALGEVFENLTDKLGEQISQGLDNLSDELSDLQNIAAQKANLEQEIDKLQTELDDLAAEHKSKSEELEELGEQVLEQKVGDALGEVFENLTESLKEQVSDSLEDLKEQAAELEQLKNQVSGQRVEQQVGDALGEVFENLTESLKEQLTESLESFSADLSQALDLSSQVAALNSQHQSLVYENDRLTKKLASKGKSKEELNKAYEELETVPDAIETFLETFDEEETTDYSESEALEQFMLYLRSQQLYYPSRVIKAFHTALKIQQINPLSVLAGVSGTGKTQLALRYAKFFGFYSEHVAVQPRWDSKDDLLGFYNFLEMKFQPTALVRALYHFDQYRDEDEDDPSIIVDSSPMMMAILDEMNLARVEYYFSEFLSKLELRNSDYAKSEITIGSNLAPRKFFVGSNVIIVGTMNDDESTYALSDKVLDRANVLHFGKPGSFGDDVPNEEEVSPIKVDYELFNSWRAQDNFEQITDDDKGELKDQLEQLNNALNHVGKPFGHRVHNSIESYLKAYPCDGESDLMETVKLALADQIEMKIIPKLAGLEQNDHSNDCLSELERVIAYTEDEPLINAFRTAKENYNNEGMFIWRGVTRDLDE